MLNKTICYKCLKDRYAIKAQSPETNESFNNMWERYKQCLCIYHYKRFIHTNSVPPKKCPYILEQTVTQGAINA